MEKVLRTGFKLERLISISTVIVPYFQIQIGTYLIRSSSQNASTQLGALIKASTQLGAPQFQSQNHKIPPKPVRTQLGAPPKSVRALINLLMILKMVTFSPIFRAGSTTVAQFSSLTLFKLPLKTIGLQSSHMSSQLQRQFYNFKFKFKYERQHFEKSNNTTIKPNETYLWQQQKV
uniref:20 kDa protein n=1 Tax=Oxytricha fallax TaxID=5944 RepID=O60943_OXYFA|nr:20 kDa protein [Oxytricha fallax]